MRFVKIDETYVNPENVCRVGPADPNGEGFLTELVDMAGKQLFKKFPNEVASLLEKAST
jgi:hypothetical protein